MTIDYFCRYTYDIKTPHSSKLRQKQTLSFFWLRQEPKESQCLSVDRHLILSGPKFSAATLTEEVDCQLILNFLHFGSDRS